MYLHHTNCRACNFGPKLGAEGTKSGGNNEKLKLVFNLGIQPLANDFKGEREERAGYAPLEVLYCPNCTLAQLSVVVKPEILYSRYLYVTSPSETMRRHFKELTSALTDEQPFHSVLEIGSNDGAYLRFLAEQGGRVCGIDPAENLAQFSKDSGIPTLTGQFDQATAMLSLHQCCGGGFDVIVARHVFCHVDNWRQFVDDLAIPSHKNTLVAIEVPYVKDLLERGEFDTIYHEHTSYLSIRAMEALLKDSPFRLQKILRFPIHGGAIVMLLRRRDNPSQPDASVQQFINEENITAGTWEQFGLNADIAIRTLQSWVRHQRAQGKVVAALGASAKSTVWVNACGFTRQDISFITDTTPQKLWKLSPGTDIPICDEGAILRELPDYMVCFVWNFLGEVVAKNQKYLELGGKIVVPIPTLRVVSSETKVPNGACVVP